ncbi:zinc-binding dehydrogenase [Streptomyces sp. NPDC047706]|uniref:zinc-binding dehydrogenase n=1 Tax=Streptomyces sp. NPDC047706 TaxID=3365486 RepID=UPI0037111760
MGGEPRTRRHHLADDARRHGVHGHRPRARRTQGPHGPGQGCRPHGRVHRRRSRGTGPVFRDHIPIREALLRHSATLFDLVRRNVLNPGIGGRYAFEDAARAHRDTESRATSGKLPLLPQPPAAPRLQAGSGPGGEPRVG